MNTTQAKHTATPFRVGDAGLTVFGPKNGNPSPETVAHCTTRANAAFIVRACNSHDELLEALQSVVIQADGDLDDAAFRAYIRSLAAETLNKLES